MTRQYRLYFHRTLIDVFDIEADSKQLAVDHGWKLFNDGDAPFDPDTAETADVRITARRLKDQEDA